MSSHKPFIPPPEPLNKSKDHYKIQGEPYKHLEIEINLISLKFIGTAILLGVPYVCLILMIDSLGLKFLTAILIGTGILIGGTIGLLYYLNRQEPVKPPANQNKRR
ncbi:MAG: hypothetical protein JGK17_24875 [Microcoleus sp. PH2017_10_PVI_O_A]|uniref:hypothetical protein n=1 Tax=unclassified Microcoleus TaxID=2642155 RepID=UPI001E0640C1|nr:MULTISPECIES: hypothetical protein [unclassified Microcoleus]TAE78673.1 MAG: hypothetical protein EAZ83_24270 [Oscillatoriales cyanobacterium]MCC3408749.1 hypothetical protein [Microcoleus sp. PH2017_10_PVI_O_A]MCC3462837.1 hypothetical protein [Microcoleus sp. PH2017_11_PCY_U_A]MCC3481320.1 hypothetical protein [Microcoleus sp. PH2017_12_PCY_D_A]MCC3531356.1 hypothetical protein [Microcoleus sp. PH2017_21_RUC_O_A]